jgi:hypothetical protein
MFNKLFKITGTQTEEERKAKLRRDLLKHEARIGGELFGPIPDRGRREFFCLDEYTWIWYEEWTDKNRNRQSRTTRYDVRPGGITKIQDGQSFRQLTDGEAIRLFDAMKAYERRTRTELYQAVAA